MAEARATLQPLHVKTPPPLQLNEHAIEEWKMCKQLFKNYQIITALEQRDKAYQCAVFLLCTGTAGIKIYNGLEFAPAGPGNDIPKITKIYALSLRSLTNISLARRMRHTRDNIMYLTNEIRNQKNAWSCTFLR